MRSRSHNCLILFNEKLPTFFSSLEGHFISNSRYIYARGRARRYIPIPVSLARMLSSRAGVSPWPETHIGEIYSSARPLKSRPSNPRSRTLEQHHVFTYVITTTTIIVVVGVSSRPLQRPLSPFPVRLLASPRAPAAAGNDGAYFIFKAGRIDNLQRRYVNAPSRTGATTALLPPVRERWFRAARRSGCSRG